MTPATALDSSSESAQGAVRDISTGEGETFEIHAESRSNDIVEERGKLPECVEDSFASLCINVERLTGLACYNDRVLKDNHQRRTYVRFTIDPGNVHVSTYTFNCTERCPKPAEMLIPASLTAEYNGSMMVMEVWEAQDGYQNEVIGHGREYIHKMVKEKSLQIPLTSRRGKTSCGKMFISAELHRPSGGLSSTLLRGSSVSFDENDVQATDLIVVMVLECQGIPRECNPVIVANRSTGSQTNRSDCADFDDKRGSFVWNHRFCFEVTLDKSLSFTLFLNDGTENRPLQKALGTFIIPFEALKNDESTLCAWVPLQLTATTDTQLDVRIRVACCLLIDNARKNKSSDSLDTTELSNSSFVSPVRAAETPIALPLGSLLEIKLITLCARTPSEVEFLRELLAFCDEGGGPLAIRGRLQLTGGNSQRCVANASARPDKTHCENQICARLQTDKGDSNILQFELSPDVVTNAEPQLTLEIRSRKSQKWRMSLWVALSFVLKNLSVGLEYQCNLPLLDQDERTCGNICANFRGGLQADFQNCDLSWTPVVHKPKTCLLSVNVIYLQALDSKSEIRCFAKVWSSATGKPLAQLVSPLMWRNGGFTSDEGETKAVSLKVYDEATDMLFVGIYRFSTLERNELIGLGSFTIPPKVNGSTGNLEIQQRVLLFSESPGEKKECGSAILTLQTMSSKQEEMDCSVSLAATSLGGVAYHVRSGEMKCRFDVGILKVLCLPVQILEGDTVTVQLRISQSNWKIDLGPSKVVFGGDGAAKYVLVGDKATAIVCWSPKDRSFPVLEITLYVQHQRKVNRAGITSSSSLTPTARVKRQRDRQAATHANEVLKPALIATGSLNLCSFFSQLNVSVHTDLQLAVEPEFTGTDSSKPESVSLLATLRASASKGDGTKSPTFLNVLDTTPQPVKGDICIHLLHATGSILRKTSCVSTYYVLISSGTQQVTSSCCSVDEEQTLTWNQQLALPVACSAPPIIYLTLFHRIIDCSKPENSDLSLSLSGDQVVGYLTLPMFPAILEEDHLLQLELPFGMPFDSANAGSVKQNDFHKRGMITLEVQFLPSQQSKSTSPVKPQVFELAIHRVRGNLNWLSPAASSTRHIFVDVSLMVERGGKTEELAVAATGVITLSTSGMTDLNEVVDLSNPIVATTLAYDSSCVLVGRIRDLTGNCYGRVHLPLRRDWKERLVNRKKQVWYPICIEENNTATTATKDAVLMSLQVAQRRNPAPPVNVPGKFYVGVSEVIIDSPGVKNSNLLKLGKYGGASVELTCVSTPGSNETRYRTRQATNQDNPQHWCWTDEWFVFLQTDEPSSSQELQMSLRIGAQSNQLNGKLDLSSTIEDAKLKRIDQWTTLTCQLENDEFVVTAHLHFAVCYIPTIVGDFFLEFGEGHTFSDSERMLQVENTFYKCIVNETTYKSTIETQDDPTDADYKQLRLPFDSRLDTSAAVPVFSVQRMGVTKALGEICLGALLIDLLLISGLCCLTSSDTCAVNNPERSSWCEFNDKNDRSKTTGVAKLRIWYESAGNVAQLQSTGTPKTAENRVAAAEVFTIWKKFFYLLDQNGNGYIDRNEFTNIFMNHLDDMVETSDGQKLLQLLFGDDGSQDKSASAPTQQQISVLFSMMDSNRDNEIEWAEYLRFLQLKQHQFLGTIKENENPAQSNADSPEVPSPQLEQKKELRKKNREDRRLPPLGSGDSSSNQNELSPEKTRGKSKSNSLKQAPSEPKRPSKTSPSEDKLLKLQYSNQEQRRLKQQISSLESILVLERRRYAELAADRQALMRSYQQLHLKHQNEIIQDQTKAKWMKQTIERQQQQLEERESLRQNRNEASIVLQSTVRSRLDQKRYQGLKLERANAAIAIQCMIKRVNAKKKLRVLQEADRSLKQRIRAAAILQRFTRLHLHRKERVLLVEARKLSATILQKNTRKMNAVSTWKRQKIAAVKVQCWFRQRRAIRNVTQIRDATLVVNTAVLGWFTRWQNERIQKSTRKLQKWWRRATKERSAFAELLEAVLCIQSAWKRRSARKWFEREWQRQEKFLSELEATICIQAAWRGRHQRRLSQSQEPTPWIDDDSVIEALLYSIVAVIEADAVDRVLSEQSKKNSTPADLAEPSLTEMLHDEGSNTEFADKTFTSDDEGTGEEEDIKHILTGILEAVIGSSESDALGGLNGSNSDAAHIRTLVDPVSLSMGTNRVEQDKGLDDDDLNEAGSYEVELPINADNTADYCINQTDAHNEIFEDSELDVIRSVLESIQDQVVEVLASVIKDIRDASTLGDTSSSDDGVDIATSITDSVHFLDESATPREEEGVSPKLSERESGNESESPTVSTNELEEGTGHQQGIDADQYSPPDEHLKDPTRSEVLDTRTPSGNSDQLQTSNFEGRDENDVEVSNSQQEDDIVSYKEVVDFNTVSPDPDSDVNGQMATDADLTEAFDTDTAVGDFAMPNDSDSGDLDENDGSDDGADGSSIDSADLMMEADEMAILQDTCTNLNVANLATRHRKTERLDSMTLLSDLDQLHTQSMKS